MPSETTSALPPTAVTTGGRPMRHGLDEADRQPFVDRRQREHVGAGEDRRRVVVVPEHHEPVAEVVGGQLVPQPALERPLSDRHEPQSGLLRHRRRRRLGRAWGSPCGCGGWPRSRRRRRRRPSRREPRAASRSTRRAASAATGAPWTSTSAFARHGRHDDATTSSDTAQRWSSSGSVSALASRVTAPCDDQTLCSVETSNGLRLDGASARRAIAPTAGEWMCTASKCRASARSRPGHLTSARPRLPARRWVRTPSVLELGYQVLLPVEEVGHLVGHGGRIGDGCDRDEEPFGPARPQPLDDVQHPDGARRRTIAHYWEGSSPNSGIDT